MKHGLATSLENDLKHAPAYIVAKVPLTVSSMPTMSSTDDWRASSSFSTIPFAAQYVGISLAVYGNGFIQRVPIMLEFSYHHSGERFVQQIEALLPPFSSLFLKPRSWEQFRKMSHCECRYQGNLSNRFVYGSERGLQNGRRSTR